jgi:hypothetical protein
MENTYAAPVWVPIVLRSVETSYQTADLLIKTLGVERVRNRGILVVEVRERGLSCQDYRFTGTSQSSDALWPSDNCGAPFALLDIESR